MSLKKFSLGLIAMFAFFCSGFVTESYLNRAIAGAEKSKSQISAETKIKEIYPKFITLIDKGAKEQDMTDFALNNLDTDAISKNFCGEANKKLTESLIKFLLWRLKTEALQSVKEYKLGDNFQVVEKKSTVSVKCLLNGKTDTVDMTILFSKNGSELGKIREIIVLNIPLIDGAKSVMRKYYEKNGIKINSLSPSERANKGCEALNNFIKENAGN